MQYLATLRDKDIFLNPEFSTPTRYKKRITVKAVVRNEIGQFAFVTNSVHKRYLLAGGGAGNGDLEGEVKRECIEEIGYEVSIVREIGRIHEFRNKDCQEYETVCFLAKSKNKIYLDTRTEDEKKNNLTVVWLSDEEARIILDKQVKMVEEGKVGFYNTAFNIVRDQIFFIEFLRTGK